MKTCTQCRAAKGTAEFYPGKARCKDCVRAYARERQRVYYATHGDACRDYARLYSRRLYGGMTAAQRKHTNREAWRRWGRPRYLERLAARRVQGAS